MIREKIIKTYFQLRRGQSEAWKRVNPILRPGEPGYELDTNKLKLGDGVRHYNDLPYLKGDFEISADDKSVIIKEDIISLFGFDEAEKSKMPIKNEEGNLEWIGIDALSDEDIYEAIGL